ncbi:MAG: alpha/beta hydrolase, partial [Bacteroidia bacterium]
MRILKKILIWLAVSIITLYILAVVMLYVYQEKLLFPAEAVPQGTNYQLGDLATEVWLERDDARLHALWTEPDSADEIVLFFHGNGEIAPRALPFALDLKARGYAVLTPDYRGYGK